VQQVRRVDLGLDQQAQVQEAEVTRRTELLFAAAEALEAGDDPFGANFLGEHDVTSDECMNLARQLAIGARVVAHGLDQPRTSEGLAVLGTMARGA
jgi:hypothetical protein